MAITGSLLEAHSWLPLHREQVLTGARCTCKPAPPGVPGSMVERALGLESGDVVRVLALPLVCMGSTGPCASGS